VLGGLGSQRGWRGLYEHNGEARVAGIGLRREDGRGGTSDGPEATPASNTHRGGG
jgi:hypothetical protein